MDLLRMRWEDVGFFHWPVEPAVVAETLPARLDVDTYDGQAYLGVVPFRMTDIRPRASPIGLSFGELNLRTYVVADGTPGVYFYNLDADDRLGVTVARSLFQLPYYRARMDVHRTDDGVRFHSTRAHEGVPSAEFAATYRPDGGAHTPHQDSLAAFLVERYRFYADSDGGTLYYADIDHVPWRLRDGTVDIRHNGLFAASGFDTPEGDPLVHYSDALEVTAGRLKRLPASH